MMARAAQIEFRACPICLLADVVPFTPFHHSVAATSAMDH
jgi:hypothetical protein